MYRYLYMLIVSKHTSSIQTDTSEPMQTESTLMFNRKQKHQRKHQIGIKMFPNIESRFFLETTWIMWSMNIINKLNNPLDWNEPEDLRWSCAAHFSQIVLVNKCFALDLKSTGGNWCQNKQILWLQSNEIWIHWINYIAFN